MQLYYTSATGYAAIHIITETGYTVYRYASRDDCWACRPWLETYDLEGVPSVEAVLAALPAGYEPEPAV